MAYIIEVELEEQSTRSVGRALYEDGFKAACLAVLAKQARSFVRDMMAADLPLKINGGRYVPIKYRLLKEKEGEKEFVSPWGSIEEFDSLREELKKQRVLALLGQGGRRIYGFPSEEADFIRDYLIE